MSSSLFKSLSTQKEQSAYTYILLTHIEYNDERNDDKKFTVWCSLFNKPWENIPGIERNNDAIIWQGGLGLPFSEKEISLLPVIQKPKPLFVYKNVSLNVAVEAEENKVIQSIRFWIINNPYHLITIKNKKYKIVVEKSQSTVDYYLYHPKKYNSYIDALSQPFLKICKEWNDEEYIRLFIKLNEWKRKDESSESKKMIKYVAEIMGKFDIWYLENKFVTPELNQTILELRSRIVELSTSILELKSDLKLLNESNADLVSQFGNDISHFPLDFSEQVNINKSSIDKKNNKINELSIELWGLHGDSVQGLIWKHDSLVTASKKINIGDDNIYHEFSEKNTERDYQLLVERIKKELVKNGIQFSDKDLNDLLLEVLDIRLSDDEQIYVEIVYPFKIEENLSAVINKVIQSKYGFEIAEKKIEKIKFATPRANRDQRIEELNNIMGHLHYLKSTNESYTDYVSQIELNLSEYNEEYQELISHLISDVILGNTIKDFVRNEIEVLKNNTGLTALPESVYNEVKNDIIDKFSFMVFNIITNNHYDEQYAENKSELNKIIVIQIQNLLPEIKNYIQSVIEGSGNSLPANHLVNEITLAEKNQPYYNDAAKRIIELESKLKEADSKYGTYNKTLLRKAYEFQVQADVEGFKLVSDQAIIKANKILKTYDEVSLINGDGVKTTFLLAITKSYSNYWRPKFIKETVQQ